MSTRSLIVQLTDRAVAHPLTGARPMSPIDGADITGWRSGAYAPPAAVIYLDGLAPATVGPPRGGAAGVELWGYQLDQWWLLGPLNGSAPVPIAGDQLGAALLVEGLGVGGYERLFVAGTMSASSGVARFVPLEVIR